MLPANALSAADMTDVPDNWSRAAIDYCLQKGLMNGVGSGRFDPNGGVSRAQVAQALYNRENSPSTSGLSNPFTDVGTQWFADAVIWCKANEVVSGSSPTTFNPSGRVTRQDICVMVYNYYTKYLGRAAETTDESVMAAAFSDWGRVSGYAKEAVRWANKTTFMRGASATTLDPTGYASRAQLAQFLKNLDAVVEPSTDPSPNPSPSPSPSSSPSPSPSPSPNPGNVFPLAMKKPLSIVAGPSQTLAINSDGTR